MRIAMISINLGEYQVFLEEFIKTAEVNFLPGTEKEYFVFTDSKIEIQKNGTKLHYYKHEDMGWPFNSMKRFGLFLSISEELKRFDYVFFANANAVFRYPLTESFILPDKKLVVVEHPGMHGNDPKTIPWERRPESRAYVSYEEGKVYVQGAFFGGTSEQFIEMSLILSELTEADISDGIIAVVHDESFLNKYIIGRDDVQILGWQYLKYEECVYPYIPVIELRNKKKYITNENGRFLNQNFTLQKFILLLRNIKWWMLIKLHFYRWYDIQDNEGNYIDLDINDR